MAEDAFRDLIAHRARVSADVNVDVVNSVGLDGGGVAGGGIGPGVLADVDAKVIGRIAVGGNGVTGVGDDDGALSPM